MHNKKYIKVNLWELGGLSRTIKIITMKKQLKKLATATGSFLTDLFTDLQGRWSCRLVFGSIGFVACLVAMFTGADSGTIAIILPTSAALLGLSAVENIKKN